MANDTYSQQELDFLREHCRLPRKEMTRRFNERFGKQKSHVSLHQVCLRRGWLTGRDGCFKKGIIVWNKGLKGFHAAGCEKGWFKKGTKPPKTRPLYSERFTKDGYIAVKIPNQKKWEHKQRVIWREHFGKIPKNHIIIFKDGNKQNCDITNLDILSRGLHVTLAKHGYYNEPEELKPLIRARVELILKVNEVLRKNAHLPLAERGRR